jgi:hypothetical protein
VALHNIVYPAAYTKRVSSVAKEYTLHARERTELVELPPQSLERIRKLCTCRATESEVERRRVHGRGGRHKMGKRTNAALWTTPLGISAIRWQGLGSQAEWRLRSAHLPLRDGTMRLGTSAMNCATSVNSNTVVLDTKPVRGGLHLTSSATVRLSSLWTT